MRGPWTAEKQERCAECHHRKGYHHERRPAMKQDTCSLCLNESFYHVFRPLKPVAETYERRP